jgi:hypothetical protein
VVVLNAMALISDVPRKGTSSKEETLSANPAAMDLTTGLAPELTTMEPSLACMHCERKTDQPTNGTTQQAC